MEEMTNAEVLTAEAKENRTREILLIMKECKDLDDAIEKVTALLHK